MVIGFIYFVFWRVDDQEGSVNRTVNSNVGPFTRPITTLLFRIYRFNASAILMLFLLSLAGGWSEKNEGRG